jgi:hypothetical protein
MEPIHLQELLKNFMDGTTAFAAILKAFRQFFRPPDAISTDAIQPVFVA